MGTRQVLVACTALALVVGIHTNAAAHSEDQAYIVVLRASLNAHSQTTRLERAHGFVSEFRYTAALHGFAARLSAAQVGALRADPEVAFVAVDAQVTAVGALAPLETVPTGVRRIGPTDLTTRTTHLASTAGVAVIDTGVDLTHPDLSALDGINCVTPGASGQDDNGHGTHVAGTIAAKNQGAGVVGVAPGTTVYAVKVLNAGGSGTFSQVICGIDWVAANAPILGIRVANMSLGGGGSNDGNCGLSNHDALHMAICNSIAAGVTYVVAAGNNASDLSTFVPAAYPEVLTVSAMSDSDGAGGGIGGAPACDPTEQDDAVASFSNFARRSVDVNHTIAAPGVCIHSTWLGGGYQTLSGTSMATPHVTGAVALCVGSGGVPGPCATLTPAQTVQRLRSDAQARTSLTPSYGFAGDPAHPQRGRKVYFGYLISVAGY